VSGPQAVGKYPPWETPTTETTAAAKTPGRNDPIRRAYAEAPSDERSST
jgi:hypothetical protein